MKVTQEEFDRFWDEVLGHDWYNDHDDDECDGESPDGTVNLDEIVIRWQGLERPTPKGLIKERDIDDRLGFLAVSTAALFKRWRKAQTTTVVMATFEVPHEGKAALLAQIKALKGKVLS